MSYKVLQLSPLSTRGTHVKILIESPWNAPTTNFGDGTFLRRWAPCNSAIDCGYDAVSDGFNWNHLLGLALAVGISASFWAGIGLALSHLLR
jgi:hypothetical protein